MLTNLISYPNQNKMYFHVAISEIEQKKKKLTEKAKKIEESKISILIVYEA